MEEDNATIVDTILNADGAPAKDSPEYRAKLTDATNKIRQLVPELKNAVQNQIINHIQASNRPVDGNGKYVSNYVAYDDIVYALLTPCQERVKTFYSRFHQGEGFLTAADTMRASLTSLELEPKQWDIIEVNTFERFLQNAVYLINNTQH